MEMSITRALAELKLADKKITQKIKELTSAYLVKKKDKAECEKEMASMQSKYQSILDLIARRNNIKRLIVASNATVTVLIGGKTMTVAEAIERKTSIELEKNLVRTIRESYYSCKQDQEQYNSNVDLKADEQAKNIATGEDVKSEAYAAIREMFVKDNEVHLICLQNCEELIEKLQDNIDEFESEVDFVLSESNTKTTIKV